MDALSYLKHLCEQARELVLESKNTKTILIATAAFLYGSYLIAEWRKKKQYFKRLNIPGPSPKFLTGSFFDMAKLGLHKFDETMTQTYGKTFGFFEISRPIVLTIDPKFIKAFLVKDFSNFVNRRVFEGLFIDPLDKFLVNLKDDEWKNTRMVIATSFTSGKLRGMAKLIAHYAKQSSKHLEKRASEATEFNVHDLFQAFVLDMGTTCLFGLETDALGDPNNVLLKHMKKVGMFSVSPKILLLIMFPKISKFLANNNIVHFLPQDSLDYLQQVVEEVIKRRKMNNERREDFIQNMLDHANEVDASTETDQKVKSTKRKLTSKEILAQAILLLGGGGDTAVITLSFMAYQLAMNPEIQERLCEELDQVMDKNNGEIDYDCVNDLKYMDMVISETLRMYPPTLRLDRICSADNYKFEDITIPKDTVCAVSIWALHRNPEFYPEPDKFDPERFSPGESKQRDLAFEGYTYMAFGTGPRGCVGMRFALIKMKLLMSEILSKYNFVKSDKTPENVPIDGSSGFCKPKVPIFLKLAKRTNKQQQ